jgi:hypothetical protein
MQGVLEQQEREDGAAATDTESDGAATVVQSDQNQIDARQIARTFAMTTTDHSDFATGSEFTSCYQNPFGLVPVELWIGGEKMSPDEGQTPRLPITEHVHATRE